MSNKIFYGIIGVFIIGLGAYVFIHQSSKPKEAIIGVKHSEQSRSHIQVGETHEPYNSDPPSSGKHYANSSAPTPWGVYTQEVPDEVFLHNEEHGGVIVTYNPKLLPADQLKTLQDLFAPPYSDPSFKPSKAVVTPRSKNTKPIELASWTYTLSLDSYDQQTLEKFYLQHVSHSPEPGAGPNNTPINQAKE